MPENMAYHVSAWTQGYEWDFEILSEEHTEQHGKKLCKINCILYLKFIYLSWRSKQISLKTVFILVGWGYCKEYRFVYVNNRL